MIVLICRAGWSCEEQWRKETSVGQGGLDQGLQVVFWGNGYVLVFVNLKQFWYPSWDLLLLNILRFSFFGAVNILKTQIVQKSTKVVFTKIYKLYSEAMMIISIMSLFLMETPFFCEIGEDDHSVAIKMPVGATITAHTDFLDKICAE